jgi:2-polyprenyl-3-methyl-5-hydroxy-6-metoxy-1,4-benzoquinol methylase
MQYTLRLKMLAENHPNLRLYVRKLRFAFWQRRIALHARVRQIGIDPLKVLWVSPKSIKEAGVGWWDGWGKYDKTDGFGRVVGGDWDLNTMPFEDLDIYQAYNARLHGGCWQDTGYFKTLATRVDAGQAPYKLSSREELTARLQSLDSLLLQIKDNGVQSQKQAWNDSFSRRALDEITVRIGRDGQLLFEDGRHRLAIAKLLNLTQIPVMVTWRHSEWYQLRSQIIEYAKRYDNKVYSPLTHPDLADIPSHHGDQRFTLIRANLPFAGGSLLDIGANWGYFCHKFEEEGFRCYGVEVGSRNFYFLQRLKIAEQRKFSIFHTNIFDFWEKSEFDVVLALNVFHHLLKTEADFGRLIQLLRRIRARVMFFEPHSPEEPQMRGAYRNMGHEEFARFVAENTGLTRFECIGHGDDGRPIYRLTAN